MTDDAATNGQPQTGVGWDDSLQAFLIQRLLVAATEGRSQGRHLDWSITVAVVSEGGNPHGELMITIVSASLPVGDNWVGGEARWSPAVVAMAKEIMGAFHGIPPTSWHVAPRRDDLCIHTKVEVGLVPELLSLCHRNSRSGHEPSYAERSSHIVRESELVQSLVDGHVVKSMCGQAFVPTETGDKARDRQVCPKCALVMALARRVAERSG